MKLVSLKCPSCGAKLEVNPSLKKYTCNYCGETSLLDDEAVVVKFKKSKLEDSLDELQEYFDNGNFKKSFDMSFNLLKQYPQNEDIRKIFVASKKKLEAFSEKNQYEAVKRRVKMINDTLFYNDIPIKELSTIPGAKFNQHLLMQYAAEYPDDKEIATTLDKVNNAVKLAIKRKNIKNITVIIITFVILIILCIIMVYSASNS